MKVRQPYSAGYRWAGALKINVLLTPVLHIARSTHTHTLTTVHISSCFCTHTYLLVTRYFACLGNLVTYGEADDGGDVGPKTAAKTIGKLPIVEADSAILAHIGNSGSARVSEVDEQ